MTFNWNLDPVLIELFGSFPIMYYSICFGLGLILGLRVVHRLWLDDNWPIEKLDRLTIYVFLATLIGARLGHCLFYEPDYFLSHPIEIFIPFKSVNGEWVYDGFRGLASHGGILAVVLTLILYSWKKDLPILSLLDKVAVGGILTGCFIRLGNFMNSEIIGKPTGGDYGVIFEQVDLIPRHPAQLYEAIAYLIIFFVLLNVHRHKKSQQGFTFGLLFILLFTSRFLIEFYKENQVAFEDSMTINMGQWLSIPGIIIGLIFIFYSNRDQSRASTGVE